MGPIGQTATSERKEREQKTPKRCYLRGKRNRKGKKVRD
jgi:hypothetical protein